MGRSLALLFCGLAALILVGCHQDGSLQVSWAFTDATAADGCGQHGVDSVLVTSGDTGTDSDQVQALCAAGVITRQVAAGTWTVTVQALDPEGNSIHGDPDPLDPTQTPFNLSHQTPDLVVADDGPSVSVPNTFTPLPACMDGVDNDGDGRVDLDDPGCAKNPWGPHE